MVLINTSTHLCLDVYGIGKAAAEDKGKICRLLEQLNDRLFDSRGMIQVIPVLDENPKPENNGINGIVNSELGHFTIHTFSQRGVAFLDLMLTDGVDDNAFSGVMRVLRHNFSFEHVDHILSADGLKPKGFGTHLILEIDKLDLNQSLMLPAQIIDVIKMVPLAPQSAIMGSLGYGIIQPITESHISVHGLHKSGRMHMDIFSCKPFEVGQVFNLLEREDIKIFSNYELYRGAKMLNKIL